MRFDNKVIRICWDCELTLGLQGVCKLLNATTFQYCIPRFKLLSVPFPLEREFMGTWDFVDGNMYIGTGWEFQLQ